MKTKKILAGLLLVVMGALIVPLTGQAVTVSPPIIELDAAKGDIIEQSIKVRNEEQSPVTYYLSAERFIASGETGEPQFIGEDIGLSTWINFPYDSINIGSGDTVEIPFQIVVPNYAGPGGHYAVIFLSTIPPSDVKGASQVSIASRIGTLVLVRIAGDIKEDAAVEEFSTTEGAYGSLPVDFSIRVGNNGNVHVKPMGTIVIKNMIGSVAGEVAVNDIGGAVLPDQIRKFDASWLKNPNAVGATSFLGKYREQKENFALGKYSAELTLAYGTAGKILNSRVSFWVIPWHLLIVDLIILLIVIGLLYLAMKRYNSWIIKKYGKPTKAPKAKK